MPDSTPAIHRIGIALAAFKPHGERFREQLRSIQEQTFQNWICAITFDSSMEETLADPEMQIFMRDDRFVFMENAQRLGVMRNFERAIAEVAGRNVEAIACADQDDIWLPEKLAKSRTRLMQTGPLSLVHCDAYLWNEKGISSETLWQVAERNGSQLPLHDLLVHCIVNGNTMLFDAELARKYPQLPPGGVFHDEWFSFVARKHGGIHPIAEPLVRYRLHNENVFGVQAYSGVFHSTAATGTEKLERCRKHWLKTQGFARFAEKRGISLGFFFRQIFIRNYDLGLGLLLLGIVSFPRNRLLGRGYFIRALGKFAASVPFTGSKNFDSSIAEKT